MIEKSINNVCAASVIQEKTINIPDVYNCDDYDFPRGYRRVAFLAGSHHELLNGKGYPDGLKAESLPWQSRLITILDVFEALTSTDRPYKPPLPIEKAFAILDDMVKAGDIDDEILSDFKDSGSWE